MNKTSIIIFTFMLSCQSGKEEVKTKSQPIKLNLGEPIVLKGYLISKNRLHFTADGRLIFYSHRFGKEAIYIWDVKNNKEINRYKLTTNSLAVSPDAKYFVLGKKNGIQIYDVKTQKIIRQFKGHDNWVEYCAFHPNNEIVASGDNNSTINIWDIKTSKKIATIKSPYGVAGIHFTQDGQKLIYITNSKTKNYVCLFNYKNNKSTLLPTPGRNFSLSLFESNNDITLANITAYKKEPHKPHMHEVQIWDVNKQLIKLSIVEYDASGYPRFLETCSFHPTGKILATGTQQGTIRLLDTKSGQERLRIDTRTISPDTKYVKSLAFSPDGKYLAAGTYGLVLIWHIL